MKKIKFKNQIELISEDDLSNIKLYYKGKKIGNADFKIEDEYIYPESVEIDKEFRGFGLYKYIVDFVIENMESMAGVSEFRSILRTLSANNFWKKYTDVSDYSELEHETGNQEQIIIDSNWNITYR